MRCPRCDGSLITFSIDEGEDAAVVCESCGFAGVPASHHSDGETPESWDAALDRLDGETLLDRTRQVARSRGVSIPDRIDDEPTVLDGDRLDEVGVSVSASIDGQSDRRDDETSTDDSTAVTPRDHEGAGDEGTDEEAVEDEETDEEGAEDEETDEEGAEDEETDEEGAEDEETDQEDVGDEETDEEAVEEEEESGSETRADEGDGDSTADDEGDEATPDGATEPSE